MLRQILGLPVALALLGCQTVASLKPTNPYSLSKQEIEQVEAGVRGRLKDPGSANFGKIVAGKDDQGKVIVCGLVNSKNSFGGYVGMSPFSGELFGGGQFDVAYLGGAADVSAAIYQFCSIRGLTV